MIPKSFFALLVTAMLVGFGFVFFDDNIHTVIPNQVYRSGQLAPGLLRYLIEFKRIKSVINLRGEHVTEEWYQDELEVTKTLGIPQYDFDWHAYKITPAAELQRFVKVVESAPRPLLIHCQGGSDRTGLASSIVLTLDENVDFLRAQKQFSIFYFVLRDDSTPKLTLPYYTKWLEEHHLESNRENLIAWVNQLQPGVNYPV